MKKTSLIFIGLVSTLSSWAVNPDYAEHPLSLPRVKADEHEIFKDALSYEDVGTKDADDSQTRGYSIEGEWKFKMYSYFEERDQEIHLYAMLVGNTLLLEGYGSDIYPLVGEYDKSAKTLTITKRYVGRDWRGRYVFVYPWVPTPNGAVKPGDITAQYDPQKGELIFPEGVMLSWIDYADPQGTQDVYDEGEWYDIYSAKRSGDLDKENRDNWTNLGTATLIDGWLTPRFGIDQTREENWLHPQLLQYKKKNNIYRLVNPFDYGILADMNDSDHSGFIEFDVKDKEHVIFNRIDAGWTCKDIGINKFYAYNVIGYYMEELRGNGENWETAQQFLYAYNNPDIPFTTFKDGVVDLGAMLYGGELVYDATFGDERYPSGGNMWIGMNMRTRIYFPDVDVNEPKIDFDSNPDVVYDSDTRTALLSLEFTAVNKPEDSYVFVMVTENKSGKNVARKYVKTGNSCSFALEDVDPESDYTIIVRIEGNLSEVITNSLPVKLNFNDYRSELTPAGTESVTSDESIPAYYNLQGIKIEKPKKGEIYIKVTGNKAIKVIF